MDYLKLACDRLGIEPGKALAHKVYDDHIAIVVDNGIKGCPKHILPLSSLQPTKPATLPEPVEAESKPQVDKPKPRRRGK